MMTHFPARAPILIAGAIMALSSVAFAQEMAGDIEVTDENRAEITAHCQTLATNSRDPAPDAGPSEDGGIMSVMPTAEEWEAHQAALQGIDINQPNPPATVAEGTLDLSSITVVECQSAGLAP